MILIDHESGEPTKFSAIYIPSRVIMRGKVEICLGTALTSCGIKFSLSPLLIDLDTIQCPKESYTHEFI